MILRLLRRPFTLVGRLASSRAGPSVEPKFSQSAAFQGRKRGSGVAPSAYTPDYYTTDEWAHKKVLSAVISLTALIIYFGWLREPSDLDDIFNTPPHILTASLERRMLREQIKEAKAKGQSTELLEAQLDYVDVKEEALRIQFEQAKKKP